MGEQCDDGNVLNLDGCDASCKFEQDQRIDYLQMQNVVDNGNNAFCTINALGGAMSGLVLSQIQSGLDAGIKDGTTSILFKVLDLDDLTGTADPMFTIGVMNGAPVKTNAYDGTNDLDWWYTPDAAAYDMMRNPLSKLPASVTSKNLSAGPGSVAVNLIIAGSNANLKLSNTKVQMKLNNTSKPKVSANNMTPGHVAAEHLDPALVSFESGGQKSAGGAGKLCGNVTAASLATVAVPAALLSGISKCGENYTAQNSLLDVFVGGCTFLLSAQIKATKPDQSDPNQPAAGAGAPYTLTADANTHKVTGCTDKNKTAVSLDACLNAAAYSSYFKIAISRVVLKVQ
jgi:cysteine-rich repeat protein